ncbi:MAG: hypothetical protein KDI55_19960 [Anaerolineae bacterium]|nr:hypothetical protein [Anaerolineae bacterium]
MPPLIAHPETLEAIAIRFTKDFEVGVEIEKPYLLQTSFIYTSVSYGGKTITLQAGCRSDGATGAWDIKSAAWWVHDRVCDFPYWDDGTPITAWQAASILSEILAYEGRWARAHYWRASTFLLGCHNTRKNGWF